MSYDKMLNLTIQNIVKTDDELRFQSVCGREFMFYHIQHCCENVYISDVVGDLDDLVGSPLLQIEEVSSDDVSPLSNYHDSFTWTFYKFATIKGSVTVKWYGTSNGYYSERVDFREVTARS